MTKAISNFGLKLLAVIAFAVAAVAFGASVLSYLHSSGIPVWDDAGKVLGAIVAVGCGVIWVTLGRFLGRR